MRKTIEKWGLALVVGLSVMQLYEALALVAEYKARERAEDEYARLQTALLERDALERAVSFEPDDTSAGDATPE